MSNMTQPDRPATAGETTTTTTRAKRPRTVYKGDEVAHRWANNADAFDIRGGNLSTRRTADGTSWLFSYQCPIAVRFTRKRKGAKPQTVYFVLPRSTDTSRTTGAHIWEAARSIPQHDGSVCFRVPVLVGGNVGAVSWSLPASSLCKPDADTHRRNLQALKSLADETAQSALRARTGNIGLPFIRNQYAEADAYRAAFLPRLAAITTPKQVSDAIIARDARLEQKEREKESAKRLTARTDWLFLRPMIQSIMSTRASVQNSPHLPSLRQAAIDEVKARLEESKCWDGWLAGGEQPPHFNPPSTWQLRNNHYHESIAKTYPAAMAFYQAAPWSESPFNEAMERLVKNGTFKKPKRYAWGHEITDRYPDEHLREICRAEIPEALESPCDFETLAGIDERARYRERITLMRLGSDGRVESNHGARVPLAIVKRAWDRFGAYVMEAATGNLSPEREAECAAMLPFGVDPYKLDRITQSEVVIGCHVFKPSEVIRFARSQGWTA